MAEFSLKVFLCILLAMLLFIKLFCWIQSNLKEHMGKESSLAIPDFQTLDVDDFDPLGIDADERYPSERTKRNISLLIHQTWKHRALPAIVEHWTKTWSINHSAWRYVYWTDESARCLIADRHKSLLRIYDEYDENIRRADALRYVILYEFGGVYVDIDIESLRSLDVLVRTYSCILAQEPYEHSIIDGNYEHLVSNSFVACAKKHPFMKLVIDRIGDFNNFWNVFDSTGPHFLSFIYKTYQKEKRPKSLQEDGVYLAPAEYFIPAIDPAKFSYMKQLCEQFHNLHELKQRACVSLRTFGLIRKPYIFSFTLHHWIHTYAVTLESTRDIFDVIPGADVEGRIRLAKPYPERKYMRENTGGAFLGTSKMHSLSPRSGLSLRRMF